MSTTNDHGDAALIPMVHSLANSLLRLGGALALLAGAIAAGNLAAHQLHSHPAGAAGETHTHELAVAITCASPPFYFMNGNYGGREWTLIASAFERADHPARPLYLPLPDAQAALGEGWVDAVWVCPSVEPAAQEARYQSEPLLPRQFVAIALANKELAIENLGDLNDKRVSVHPEVQAVLGNALQPLERDNPSFHPVGNHALLAMMLFTGRLDVLLAEKSSFAYYRQQLPPSVHPEQAVVAYPIFPPAYPHLVFTDRTLRDEFDTAWKAIREEAGVSDQTHLQEMTPQTRELKQEGI